MNFTHNSPNFNSATQQSQQTNVNTFPGAMFYPNYATQYAGFQSPPFGNYPYYGQTTQNGYFNYTSKVTESPLVKPKREITPLIVYDPLKNEEIDLTEVCRASKSKTSLLDEIRLPTSKSNSSVSKITTIILNQNSIVTKEESGIIDQGKDERTDQEDQNQLVQDSNLVRCKNEFPPTKHDDVAESNNLDSSDLSHERCKSSKPVTIKTSFSIPDKLEMLATYVPNKLEVSASVDDLHQKLTSISACTEKDNDTKRRIYDRDTLVMISKSPLCRKPKIDCTEILENQGGKNIDMMCRSKGSNDSLVRTEHGYLPPHLRLQVECSINKSLDKVRRNFKAILNKIAPQNFDLCLTEIQNMITATDGKDICVEDCMKCLIEEIFDKAVQEESYSVTYADLCSQIVKFEEKNDIKWSFKLSLINRCKTMFETPLQEQLTSVRLHWEQKAENETDGILKKLYQSDIEEQVKKAKDKYFGNIRFIGELYLKDLLKASIIDICVKTLLLKYKEEDAVLSLCKLLETCGKKFDNIYNDKMKEYINAMTDIADAEEMNTRIRFRLHDIIDMSSRNWSLRKVQAQKMIQPKTLDQVKKDDLDEKLIEASKFSNRSQIRMSKKHVNSADLKFKPIQSKNQSLNINSLQMPTNDTIKLKPLCSQWAFGSGSKDDEWQSVESKRKMGYNKSSSKHLSQNIKSSPVRSRDESPSKGDNSGRFALLQQIDITEDMVVETKDVLSIDKELPSDANSPSSTREQSPINLKIGNNNVLDADGIFQRLVDTCSFDVVSWCQISNVDKTLAIWLDAMMEKGKAFRNMIGGELAKLVVDGKLSVADLTSGLQQFLEDIEDLKTDIPLIWNFLAEFLERFIVNSESDIDFYKTIFASQRSLTEVVNCIALCLKFATVRLSQKIIKNVMKNCIWSFEDFVKKDLLNDFLSSNELDFLLTEPIDLAFFEPFKEDLISLLSKDDEDVNQFLDQNFDTAIFQTEECVYFISRCVFDYIGNLLPEDITAFLFKKKLFFLRLLDRRSEFEQETLQALNDVATLLSEKGLLTTVVNGLSDSILTYDAFLQFVQRDEPIDEVTHQGWGLTCDAVRSMLANKHR